MTMPARAALGAAFAVCAATAASALTLENTGFVGGGAPVPLYQPSLALTPVVVKNADFDAVGEVFWFAGGFAPPGTRVADGRIFNGASENSLFTKFGTTFGGAGSSFALPDLRGRGVVGRFFGRRDVGTLAGRPSVALQPADLQQHTHEIPATGESTGLAGTSRAVDIAMPTIALTVTTPRLGLLPSATPVPGTPKVGFGTFDADTRVRRLPGTVYELNGILLDGATDPLLFSAIGAGFGGQGSSFALPNMVDTLGIGADPAQGMRFAQRIEDGIDGFVRAPLPLHDHALADGTRTAPAGRTDAELALMQESQAWTWLIAIDGTLPLPGGIAGDFYTVGQPFIGEVRPFLGASPPPGWAIADGALLDPATSPALFAILGTTYGGDGASTFALPDLRGRTPIGAGTGRNLPSFRLGEVVGGRTAPLSLANLPIHSHQYIVREAPPPPSPNVPLPATAGLLASALAGVAWLRRRPSAAR